MPRLYYWTVCAWPCVSRLPYPHPPSNQRRLLFMLGLRSHNIKQANSRAMSWLALTTSNIVHNLQTV